MKESILKRLLVFGVLLLLLLSPIAAQEIKTGLGVTGGFLNSTSELPYFGGQLFVNHFGAEICGVSNPIDTGDYDTSIIKGTILIGFTPLVEQFSVYGKVGQFKINSSFTYNDYSYEGELNSTIIGVGARLFIWDYINIFAEIEAFLNSEISYQDNADLPSAYRDFIDQAYGEMPGFNGTNFNIGLGFMFY